MTPEPVRVTTPTTAGLGRVPRPAPGMLRQGSKFRIAWATQKVCVALPPIKRKARYPLAAVIREACLVRVGSLQTATQWAGYHEDSGQIPKRYSLSARSKRAELWAVS